MIYASILPTHWMAWFRTASFSWMPPEIREILYEAGFSQVDIYWEGTDEEKNEGNGIYAPSEIGDADPGWVCYIVAQP